MFWRKRVKLGKILATTSLAAIVLISLSAAPTSELEYQVDSVELTLYRDGLVHVTQALTVNETYPSASFPLLASSIENVLALDENQTLLDYETDGPQITVFTLGATRVFLEYDTISITRKEAEVWTLNLTGCPYNLTVCLPEESTIVYLNTLPTSIDTEDGKITLSLFPGDWEISYVLPIIIPASFTISDLTVTPSEVEVGDEVTISATVTNVGGTEGFYTVALEVDGSAEQSKTVTLAAGASTTVEFMVTQTDAGTYSVKVGELESEFVVSEPAVAFRITDLTVTPEEVEARSQVTVSVTVTNDGTAEGSYSVVLKINGAEEDTETVVLAGGASTTVEFTVTRTDEGTYSVQVDDLQSQFTIRPSPARFPIEYLIVIAIPVIVACGLIFLRKRGPKAEKILKERPELRQEDRDVIEFISEREGKVLEAEIREAFPDLPRTTLWRLVRRLEKMDIVAVKKIGLQNQIELKK